MVARNKKTIGLSVVATLSMATGAWATETGVSMGINFACVVGGGGPSPGTSEIPVGGVAGVPAVQQTNWFNSFPGTGAETGLIIDRAGVAEISAATMTFKSQGPSDPTTNNHFESATQGPPALQNFELMQGYLDTDDNTTTRVNIRNLPAADFAGGYDLYVYFSGFVSARGGTYGVGPIFTPPPEDPNAVPSVTFQPNKLFNGQAGGWVNDPDLGDIFLTQGPAYNGPDFVEDVGAGWDDVGNYGVFRGLTALEFTLFATVVGDRTYGFGERERAPISAIQLVPVALPTWAVDSDGDWTVPGNWTGGSPNGKDKQARFMSVITAPHTVSVNAPITVGTMTFENSNAYTIGGPSTLTLETTAGGANVNVNTGSHKIDAQLILASDTTFNVSNVASTLTLTAVNSTTRNLTKVGAGTLQLNLLSAGGLALQAGQVVLAANGTPAAAARLNSLSVNANTKLDLNDNDLILNYGTNASPFSTIRDLMLQGLSHSVDPAKTGIISSTGQVDGDKVLAVVDNALAGLTTFAGGTVPSTAVLGKYTYFGDMNLDGQVTGDDYPLIDLNLNTTPAPGNAWLKGDANLDGAVTGDDYPLIDLNLGKGVGNPLGSAALSAVAVPEPGSAALLLGCGLGLLAQRRRRR